MEATARDPVSDPSDPTSPSGERGSRPGRRSRLAGHLRTLVPAIRHRIVPAGAPEGRPWRHRFEDPESGTVELQGVLSPAGGERDDHLLVLVHGLGGSIGSHYMAPACRAALGLGLSCLRLNLRGAGDRLHLADLYHAGLSDDLHQTLRSAELDAYRRIDVMGFSLGGHVALKFATETRDPRVGAVAAVCSPLDLAATVDDFDALPRFPYREYIVGGVKRNVLRILEGRRTKGRRLFAGVEPEAIRRVTSLRGFDAVTVVPRFGFEDTEHYYRSQSVKGRLESLRRPALLLTTEGDPMVTARSVRAALSRGAGELRVAWSPRGGHVGFPPGVDLRRELGLPAGAPEGYEGQVIAWLLEQRLEERPASGTGG